MKVRLGLMAAAALSLGAVAPALLPLANAETATLDVNGKSVTAESQQRILAIGGDVTEILYAVGAQSQIIAVDATSQFPSDALKDKKNVGYMRALSTEGVLSTSPSMILASRGAGPVDVVKALKSSGVTYVEVPDEHDPKGVAAKVRLVARAAGAADKGEALAKTVEQDFAVLDQSRQRVTKPLKAIFVLGVQKGMATVAGAGTSGDAILQLAGMTNAATSFNGFKPMTDESLIEIAPEVIVVMRRSDPQHDALKALDELKGVQETPAAKTKRIVAMDALYLLGFGPRAPAAARELMTTVYPDLAANKH